MNKHTRTPSEKKPETEISPVADNVTQASSLEIPIQPTGPVKFDLLKSFALLSLLTIIFITSIAAFLLSGFVTEQMLQEEAMVSQQFIQSAARTEQLPDTSYQKDFFPNKRWLAGYLQRIGGLQDTPLVKMYSTDTSIIWSTDRNLIGLKFEDNKELSDALAGNLIYKREGVEELDSDSDKTDLSYFAESLEQVIEIYIPLWNANHDQVIAVVELYKTPERLFATLYELKFYIWSGAILGGMLLFFVLFSIVRQANNTMRKQREAIVESEALATIGEMTSAMAHGIRNPLASIRSSAELALLTPQSGSQMAENIIVSVDRLQDWIKEFIQFTETDRKFVSQVIVFDRLVKESVGLINEQANSQNIATQLLPFETYTPVTGDPALLRQLMAIILDNALEAMPDGGILTIKLSRNDDHHLRLDISDNGVGIPENQIKSVFKPFISSKKHALGLGLMMAQRIAQHHKGHLLLTSQEGEGTTVSIILPMLADHPYKILIIDNENTFTDNLKSYLEQFEFEVFVTDSAHSGLKKVTEWHPEIVLMETKLPDMDGLKLCREINKRYSGACIIALTGQTTSNINQTQNSSAKLRQAGVRTVLTKPLPLIDIRTELEKAKAPLSETELPLS